MRVLGLDTATRATAVALLDSDSGRGLECRDDPPAVSRPRHTAKLLGLVARALRETGLDWADIDLVAVGTGPGTFTGIRIGVSSARALAAARERPIVGVSTLRALAAGAAPAAQAAARRPLAVLDARRHEVFAAGWSTATVRDPAAPAHPRPRALAPGELAGELAGDAGSWLAVGDGALAYRAVLQDAGIAVAADAAPEHRVSALQICRLALDLPAGAVDDVHPEYLRLADAELHRRAVVEAAR